MPSCKLPAIHWDGKAEQQIEAYQRLCDLDLRVTRALPQAEIPGVSARPLEREGECYAAGFTCLFQTRESFKNTGNDYVPDSKAL